MAGDQHAATLGQACFEKGMLKSTYGTGCFALLNTGETAVSSSNQTAHHHRLSAEMAKVTYALEGSIFIAGAAVQWLRDGLGIIDSAKQSGELAAEADEHQHVYMIPAFTGLGAPWWDAEARGALIGLTRGNRPGGNFPGSTGICLLPNLGSTQRHARRLATGCANRSACGWWNGCQ